MLPIRPRELLFGLFLLSISGRASAQTRYEVTDLGTLGGATAAYAVNSLGQAAGESLVGGLSHAFLASDGGILDLGTLGGAESIAWGINDSGWVVGLSWADDGFIHPFLYTDHMIDLGSLGGTGGAAYAINSSSEIVGGAATPSNVMHAFRYSAESGMQDLGALGAYGDYEGSTAYGINSVGDVVGSSSTQQVAYRAFLSKDSRMRDLGSLGGEWSRGLSINDSGEIVGWSEIYIGTDFTHPFSYTEAGGMVDLGSFGGRYSSATSINSSGQIVGISGGVAFLYEQGRMVDLNSRISPDSGWVLTQARSINDLGQIAGVGLHNGLVRAYLLTPAER